MAITPPGIRSRCSFSLGFGKTTWPGGATSVLILELLLLAVAFVGGWWILRKIGVLEKVKD
ncbi:hypothetical protein GS454_21875, partial [Rhodococcus hoagii]|nr:hypothetical protein [Prescottella equi]